MDEENGDRDDERTDSEPADGAMRQWTSSALLGAHSEAIIVHAGEVYRLRCTRNNKLILTK